MLKNKNRRSCINFLNEVDAYIDWEWCSFSAKLYHPPLLIQDFWNASEEFCVPGTVFGLHLEISLIG